MTGFDDFVADQLDPLARYAQLLCGDRQDAHDLVADTLVAAHQRWHRIGGMEFPAAYVRTMVTSRHLDERRRSRRRHRHLAAVAAAGEPTSAAAHERTDDRSELDVLLRGLPARQRAAVVLRYYLDLPDEVIAAELGITASTVRSSIARALVTLRRATSDAASGE